MKEVKIDNNPFKEGMVFKTIGNIADVLGITDKKHTQLVLKRLSHYCEYHRDNNGVTIDKTYDQIIPYKIRGFKYNIGDNIITNSGSYLIIDRYIRKNQYNNYNCNTYKCECNIDGYIFELSENRISSGIACPICGHKKVVPYIRSLWDERPDLLKYLEHPDDAKKITAHSGTKIACICPECGNKKDVMVNNLSRYGFSCNYCSDGLSYPNKFVRNVLKQLNIEYIPEKSFDWSNGKIYDEYVPQLNLIIENHGLQHYKTIDLFNTTVDDQRINDINKKQLALKNGINIYIELDCRESSISWIKNSIMNSQLPCILNFCENDISWDECHIFASTNKIIKEISEYWKSDHNLVSIASKYKMDVHTVSDYLEIGSKCGYCDFEKNNNQKNGRIYISQAKSKPIYCIDDDIYFSSKKVCQDYYRAKGDDKFNGQVLYKYINAAKPYHHKIFEYISKKEFNDFKKQSIENNNINVIGELYAERYV